MLHGRRLKGQRSDSIRAAGAGGMFEGVPCREHARRVKVGPFLLEDWHTRFRKIQRACATDLKESRGPAGTTAASAFVASFVPGVWQYTL